MLNPSSRKWQWWLLTAVVLSLAIATSCASGPKPPEPGTPAFYWGAAKVSYKTGDFVKTGEQLQQILGSENEFTTRARTWDIVIAAGLAQGYSEMADAYEAGARMNRANPTPFRKQVIASRSYSSAASVELAESVHKFLDKNKDANVLLPFGLPAGTFAQPASLKKVSSGILIQDSERDALQSAMLQRGVLQVVCKAVDAADEPAKASEKLKVGETQVPRDVFLWMVARQLEAQSQLYGPNKLDTPNRFLMMSQEALESIKAIPETKESKTLAQKIQKAMDKLKKPGV
jgi:hypothetical protein